MQNQILTLWSITQLAETCSKRTTKLTCMSHFMPMFSFILVLSSLLQQSLHRRQPISCYCALSITPESIRKPQVFKCFQGVLKETRGMKWVVSGATLTQDWFKWFKVSNSPVWFLTHNMKVVVHLLLTVNIVEFLGSAFYANFVSFTLQKFLLTEMILVRFSFTRINLCFVWISSEILIVNGNM